MLSKGRVALSSKLLGTCLSCCQLRNCFHACCIGVRDAACTAGLSSDECCSSLLSCSAVICFHLVPLPSHPARLCQRCAAAVLHSLLLILATWHQQLGSVAASSSLQPLLLRKSTDLAH